MVKNRNIPFGYCMVNGKYALNALEAETVQEIFKKYILLPFTQKKCNMCKRDKNCIEKNSKVYYNNGI